MPSMSGGGCVIDYALGESGQILVFSDVVLEHFKSHRQVRVWDREAGGQLFARIDGARIIVVEATGPRRGDRRTRTLYVPDRKVERFEIEDRFRLGLHFVGDWHTHPEKIPYPSDRDINSIGESVLKSGHNLKGFVLAVVGTSNMPDCLSVLLHDGTQARTLYPT